MLRAYLLILAASADKHGPSALPEQAAEIVTCRFANGKAATVTKIGNRYTYRYGPAGHPEINLTADPMKNAAYKRSDMFPRAGSTQLRFVNGATSYVLFHYFNLGNYARDYEGATEISGLLVLQHGKVVSARLCKASDELADDTDLGSLPDDPVDVIDNIIDAANHEPATPDRSRSRPKK